MPEIEFVDPDGTWGLDEELDAGLRRGEPRHAASGGRWRTTRVVRLGVAALGAVVVGSVVVAALPSGGHHPSASSTFSADTIRAPEAPASAFRVDHLGSDAPEGARPGTLAGQSPTPSGSIAVVVVQPCPDVDACRIDDFVTPRVIATLRAHLPGVRRISGSSVVAVGRRPTLRTRQVTAQDGRLSVRINVRAASPRERSTGSLTSVGAGTTLSATAIRRGYAVTVTISGPDTDVPGVGVSSALAADPRLLAVD